MLDFLQSESDNVPPRPPGPGTPSTTTAGRGAVLASLLKQQPSTVPLPQPGQHIVFFLKFTAHVVGCLKNKKLKFYVILIAFKCLY